MTTFEGDCYLQFVNLTEFPDLSKITINNKYTYNLRFENCKFHIVKPIPFPIYYFSLINSEITFDIQTSIPYLIISDSIVNGIDNIICNLYDIFVYKNNVLLENLRKGLYFKNKDIRYNLLIENNNGYNKYNFLYDYLDYNIGGVFFYDNVKKLIHNYKKIKLIKSIEALQKKLRNGIQ